MLGREIEEMCTGCSSAENGRCTLSQILEKGQRKRVRAGKCENAVVIGKVDNRRVIVKRMRRKENGSWIWGWEAGK